jgi:hypothetical protein
MSKDNGVIVLKQNKSPSESINIIQRKPNDTFFGLADRHRSQLKDVHKVSDMLMGKSNPRQSSSAKQMEIDQSLRPQSSFIYNYNDFTLDIAQILCDFMPYCLTENFVVQIDVKYGKMSDPMEVNQQEFDWATGQAKIVANDLTVARFKVMPTLGDDSTTSKERQLKEFIQLIEAVGNTLFQIDPRILAKILSSWPNSFAHEAGTSLAQFADQNNQAQQQAAAAETQADMDLKNKKIDMEMEKIKKPRFNIRLSPQDLSEAPQGFQVMMQLLNAMNAQQPQAAAQPQVMPQGQGMPSDAAQQGVEDPNAVMQQ